MTIQAIEPYTEEEKAFRDAYRAYQKGGSIDDSQLNVLIKYFTKLERTLHLMGPEWRMSWAEASRNLSQLENWKLSRGRK